MWTQFEVCSFVEPAITKGKRQVVGTSFMRRDSVDVAELLRILSEVLREHFRK